MKKSLKLLEELPVIRDTVFDYYSNIFDVSIANYIKLEVILSSFLLLSRLMFIWKETNFVVNNNFNRATMTTS